MNADIVKSGLTEVMFAFKSLRTAKRTIPMFISGKIMDNFANVHMRSVQGCDYYDIQCCAQTDGKLMPHISEANRGHSAAKALLETNDSRYESGHAVK